MTTKVSTQTPSANQHPHKASPKWAAYIEDQHVPSPDRKVKAKVLKTQAAIAAENILVRDHNGQNDWPLADEAMVDLAEGNVFYAVAACDVPEPGCGQTSPKLAFFIDDRPEVTLLSAQTGITLRELFGIAKETKLYRDFESPTDESIDNGEKVNFVEGPVFYTRRKNKNLTIFVNDKEFTDVHGVKPEMTGLELARLVSETPENCDVYALPNEKEIGLSDTVKIQDCDRFKVVRKTVTGGYEVSRVERELAILEKAGAKVTYVPEVHAVVYHSIPARRNYPHLQSTDVLVPIPGGYPAQPLDWAYLPQGSPLLNRVVGSPQSHTINALGRSWQQVSYHPHNGGGAPAWNINKHGFHTYVDELLTWVHRANQ